MTSALQYQLVYTKRETTKPSIKWHVVSSLFLLVAFGFKIWIQCGRTWIGYELAGAQDEMVKLDMERRELDLHLSVLLRRDNLEHSAMTRLGLKPLAQGQAVKVRNGGAS